MILGNNDPKSYITISKLTHQVIRSKIIVKFNTSIKLSDTME